MLFIFWLMFIVMLFGVVCYVLFQIDKPKKPIRNIKDKDLQIALIKAYRKGK